MLIDGGAFVGCNFAKVDVLIRGSLRRLQYSLIAHYAGSWRDVCRSWRLW